MPLPSVTFRSELEPVVRKEFDQLDSELTAYLLQEHDDDGRHTKITATGLTVTGPVAITGGPVTINGAPIAGGGGAPAAHHATHEPGGADAIVALSGAVITTGTVADARLSANVPLKNQDNTFAGFLATLTHANAQAGYYERNRAVPVGEWQPYTPIWSGSGATQPGLGNSTLTGRYSLIGKTCFLDLYFVAGSTATFGNGNFLFSVPVAAKTVSFPGPVIPAFVLTNATAQYWPLLGIFQTTTQLVFLVTAPGTDVWRPAYPAAAAAGDVLHVTGQYEIA